MRRYDTRSHASSTAASISFDATVQTSAATPVNLSLVRIRKDIDPDHSGGGGSVTLDGSQNSEHEKDKSDEHHSALAALPAAPRGAATIWTAGICTSVVAVSWSGGTCTSLQNEFAARRSRSQRASANESIASAPPSREELRNEPEKTSLSSPDTLDGDALQRDTHSTSTAIHSHAASAAAGTGGEFTCVNRMHDVSFVRNEPEISSPPTNFIRVTEHHHSTLPDTYIEQRLHQQNTAAAHKGYRSLAISGLVKMLQTTTATLNGVGRCHSQLGCLLLGCQRFSDLGSCQPEIRAERFWDRKGFHHFGANRFELLG
jgi:hypothetical protein